MTIRKNEIYRQTFPAHLPPRYVKVISVYAHDLCYVTCEARGELVLHSTRQTMTKDHFLEKFSLHGHVV